MIYVDVFVPSVDKTYNFALNERVEIKSIISEITEMIEQKERITLVGDINDIFIYNRYDGTILPKENTLSECSVKNGFKLILV